MPIYVYQGNKQISTNAIRNGKAVKAIYAKEQGQGTVCVWGIDNIIIFTYTVTDNKITITGLVQNKEPTSLIIPAQIEGLYVTTIASNALKDKNKIKEAVIPNSVARIGEGAFSGCSSLESITIPFVGAKAGVTSSNTYQYPFGYIFGTSSYDGGIATEQSYFGSSTSSVTSTTYYIPSSLKSVTVTGGNILYGAFRGCTGFTSVTIGGNVTSIGDWAFDNCSSLSSVTIPDSVTSIGEYAFSHCSGLTSVTIGNSVKNIRRGTFYNCRGLTSVTIPDSVTSIGKSAFYECNRLPSVTIPDSVTSIGETAFYGCAVLTSIIFNSTKAQWNAITKGSYWDTNTGNYTIHCTDGDIPKQ